MTFVQSLVLCCPDHVQHYECTEVDSVGMKHDQVKGSGNSHTSCFVLHFE